MLAAMLQVGEAVNHGASGEVRDFWIPLGIIFLTVMLSVSGSSCVPGPLWAGLPIDLENETGISGDSDAISLDEPPEDRFPPCRALFTRESFVPVIETLSESAMEHVSSWRQGPGRVAHLAAECQHCPLGIDVFGPCTNCPDGILREGED